MSRRILKIGVILTHEDRLLLVKKRGAPSYILPGGKPEQGESDSDTIMREVDEELGCKVDPLSLVYLGSFEDKAADLVDAIVIVRAYAARVVGHPKPCSEIEALKWFDARVDNAHQLAPSLRNQILPFLFKSGRLRPASIAR